MVSGRGSKKMVKENSGKVARNRYYKDMVTETKKTNKFYNCVDFSNNCAVFTYNCAILLLFSFFAVLIFEVDDLHFSKLYRVTFTLQ